MFKRTLLLGLALAWQLTAVAQTAPLCWHDARQLTVEGKGWTNTSSFYDRLPSKAERIVRPPVWSLSKDSAGMCVRFVTDASEISARWTLRKDKLEMPHMPATGVSGLDLYVKENGKWMWTGAGRPQAASNECSVARGLRPAMREFALYLPLYNGVKEVEIGVPGSAKFEAAPVRPQKPIVFYGTSILQGGCAARPGMAYPSIIGRKLDWPTINLGFSGNAKSEPELADLLAELDPAAYVLDPLPNMTSTMVNERIEPLVNKLRQAHPKTPIVLVESITYSDARFVQTRFDAFTANNAALKAAYQHLRKSGVKSLYYISTEGLLGDDGEGTVDGTHPTDLGFLRMADAISPALRKIVKPQR